MTSRTRFRSLSRTGAVLLTTCDTVPIETCARSAISFMVAGLVIRGNSVFVVGVSVRAAPRASVHRPFGSSLCVLNAAESQSPRTVHARRHHQEFTVLCQFICLGEIPDRSLRLVITCASQNSTPCMLIQKFIRPLPHIANQVHYSVGTRSFRMSGHGIGTSHCAALVRNGDSRSIPLISPRIEAPIRALGSILPFPFARQSLPGPGGIST